ncbi:hypothetical protein KDA_49980 [Dictyobacter alpinus]|uniref:Adhesin domain-containing protein n=1 Tax=Dictyobacter alpinus TaxID=2014873 RepID=A0A402BDQ9_9CHLR|nr:hypothetical protein [Dictyobacter alpinus]GCE29514.1 hypothetical protein KDA_49980 [Dictyobacter alpinus]
MYYTEQRKRRRRSGPLFATLIILFVCAGIGFFLYRGLAPTVVTMKSHPIVAVESCSAIHVTGTAHSNDVIIQTVAGGSYPKYQSETDGNALYIKGRLCLSIDIQVPVHTDLHLIASSSIDVSNVTGEMQLKGGTIHLFQSTVQGKSTLNSGSDPLFFKSSLDRQATMTVQAISALVDIELPQNSSFHLDLTGSPFSFNTTFPDIQLKVVNSSHVADVHTHIGSNPEARLSIQAIDAPVLLTGA